MSVDLSSCTIAVPIAPEEPAQQATEVYEPIHKDADLQAIALAMLTRAIKDLRDNNTEPEVEKALLWITTQEFRAMCIVADLDPVFTAELIEKICGLEPDMTIVQDMNETIRKNERRAIEQNSGVDDDLEAMRWED